MDNPTILVMLNINIILIDYACVIMLMLNISIILIDYTFHNVNVKYEYKIDRLSM
jgi:hypothetical protein